MAMYECKVMVRVHVLSMLPGPELLETVVNYYVIRLLKHTWFPTKINDRIVVNSLEWNHFLVR